MDQYKVAIYTDLKSVLSEDQLYLDTETTGLGLSDEIVSIALVDGKGCVVWERFVKPTKPIPDEAAKVHGITNEAVSCAPTFAQLYGEFCDLVRDRTVAIYNADFDVRMIR